MTDRIPQFGPGYYDWLADQARDIASDLPQAVAVQMATDFYLTVGRVNRKIPYTIIFHSEGLVAASSRLYTVMKTPDQINEPAQISDPQVIRVHKELDKFLGETVGKADTMVASSLAGLFLAAIVEVDPEARKFFLYQDLARKHPVYFRKWSNNLSQQFGGDYSQRLESENPDFLVLLNRSAELGRQYWEEHPPQPLESLGEIILQGFRAVENHGIETVRKWRSLRDERIVGEYRRQSYALRGLSYGKFSFID